MENYKQFPGFISLIFFFFLRKQGKEKESITYTAQQLNKQRGEAKLQLRHHKKAGGVQGVSCPWAWPWMHPEG